MQDANVVNFGVKGSVVALDVEEFAFEEGAFEDSGFEGWNFEDSIVGGSVAAKCSVG